MLEEGVKIKKIKTVSYNSVTKEAVVLVLLVLPNDKTELRYYLIKELLLESKEDYKVIRSNIDNFFFENDTLIMS